MPVNTFSRAITATTRLPAKMVSSQKLWMAPFIDGGAWV